MSLNSICIVAEAYPDSTEAAFPFVQQLASSLSNIGCKCSVIAPQSIMKVLVGHRSIKPLVSFDREHEQKILVLRPYILTFSNSKNRLLLWISDVSWKVAINNSLKKIQKKDKIDSIYCYFWHVALKTASAKMTNHIPLFVQASECEIGVFDYQKKADILSRIKGVVCASAKNRRESIEAGLTRKEKTCIAVNGYRPDEFHTINKIEARKKLGFPENAYIVAFVGGFIKRKGLYQLNEALSRFDDVYSIFIGKGDIEPIRTNRLFAGTLSHNEIVNYLNCADVFVLPTEAEGCCNAIIEALACGLPVISSKKDFNDEILDESCSIRIDEKNVNEIFSAIKKLKDDRNELKRLSEGAIRKSKSLTIGVRAQTIKDYIEEVIGDSHEK